MNDFDMTCRRMVKDTPEAFLPWLFPDFDTVARRGGWVDTRRIAFPGEPDQTGDLVFELDIRDPVQPPWAVALEFQLEPDPHMFGRLLSFLGTLSTERQPDPERGSRYQLGAVVINLTGTTRSLPASARFTWPGQTPMGCALTVCERHLAEERAEVTLEAIGSGRYDRALLPWVTLMISGSDPAVIAQWMELAGQEPDARRRAELGSDLLVFAEKSADPDAWKRALEGWAMVKSQWLEQNRQEGRKELLIGLLSDMGEVPADLVEKIRACMDPAQLLAWAVAAKKADTFDAFRHLAGL
jgi:hypothetical protein